MTFALAVLLMATAHAQTVTAPICRVALSDRDTKRYGASLAVDDAQAGVRMEALLDCLADPDPSARDDFAFTTFAAALRSKDFPVEQVRRAQVRLVAMVSGPDDAAGVQRPFAAVALAEVARYDRLSPFLDVASRRDLVAQACAFMRGVRDYRGFVPGEGWRHGVAHGADLLMQLALNPALDAADGPAMLGAIAAQVAPPGNHSYIHGESARLVRPVLFLAATGKASDADLAAFFGQLKPDQSSRWTAAYASIEGLAAVHNSRAFATTMLVEALRSKDPQIQRLEPLVMDLLRALP